MKIPYRLRQWFAPRMEFQTPIWLNGDPAQGWLGNVNGYRTWYGRRYTTWRDADDCRRSWPSHREPPAAVLYSTPKEGAKP